MGLRGESVVRERERSGMISGYVGGRTTCREKWAWIRSVF
jgi:hypothetical protein